MAERYIPEHRRTQFKAKNTFKPEELRRRREEQQVEIRKAKREENLAKRRGIGTGDSRPGASLGAAPDSDDETVPTESQVCFFLPLPAHVADGLAIIIPPYLVALAGNLGPTIDAGIELHPTSADRFDGAAATIPAMISRCTTRHTLNHKPLVFDHGFWHCADGYVAQCGASGDGEGGLLRSD
jgi:hypothetical protein